MGKNLSPHNTSLFSAASLAQQVKLWEKHINESKNFYPILPGEEEEFIKLLRYEDDEDSYLTSPVYYFFTGRKGLWIYRDGNSFIPLCWHPNIPGQILVFPLRGEKNHHVMNDLLASIPEPPRGLRLARIKSDTSTPALFERINDTSSRSIVLAPVIEHVLDWKYPVRILSTKKVVSMAGHSFKRIRNHVRHLDRKNVAIQSLASEHKIALEVFIRSWVENYTGNPAEREEFLGPYQKILGFLENKNIAMSGLVFFIDKKIHAFTLWDISNSKTLTANRFINICSPSYRGLADFVMSKVAGSLYNQGIHYMNLGGSEKASLDQFKNKYAPECSLDLCSVDVLIDDIDAYEQTADYVLESKTA